MDSNPESTDEPEGAREAAGLSLAFGGFDTRDGRSAVLMAGCPAAQLWEAMRNDRMPQYFEEHRTGDTLGADVDRT
ncbi:hypothetical protein J5Y04_39395 [Kitasatospora sp. RG8]|uniref:hypothetical protein n=1 Tax=Kitasatospora sp. RG8 TaxID=2820815 RepID=UPI001AE03419|nr:hypothetical protein [Kitasatospora sp. RG8]MBP0455542.1 hypothetical protein [Kitasatospora sp. RG8]